MHEMTVVEEVLQMTHVWEDCQPQLLPDQTPGVALQVSLLPTPACCLLLGKPFLSHNPTRGTSILGVDAHLGGFVLVNSTGSCIHPAESSALSITRHLCTHWNQHRHRQSSQGNNQPPRCPCAGLLCITGFLRRHAKLESLCASASSA